MTLDPHARLETKFFPRFADHCHSAVFKPEAYFAFCRVIPYFALVLSEPCSDPPSTEKDLHMFSA
jgi:hypothetical protein